MTQNVVNNGEVNAPSDGVTQGIYEESSTQQGPLGARRALNDGRVFRYAEFTAVANAAGVLVGPDETSQIADEMAATAVVNSAGTATDIASSDSVSRLFFLDTDILTAANSDDVFAGGYLHLLNSATGGYTFRIRENAYTASTSVMRVDLYDQILENIDSQDEVAITGSPYQNITILNNGTDDFPAGVTVMNMTASYYGWVQTWGVGTVLADESAGTIAGGTIATLSDGVNGAAHLIGGDTIDSEDDIDLNIAAEPIVGHWLGPVTDANYGPIFLTISP